jgi:F0F1-type ATP synthase membrane subunit c/vacuolar-type H+-ATPase subunit K
MLTTTSTNWQILKLRVRAIMFGVGLAIALIMAANPQGQAFAHSAEQSAGVGDFHETDAKWSTGPC